VKLLQQSLTEFAKAEDNQAKFDLIICHWLFHCIPEWKPALLACLTLARQNARLVWLNEDGDLYRALDQLPPFMPVQENENLYKLFAVYYKSLVTFASKTDVRLSTPEWRAGTTLRNTAKLTEILSNYGWSVFTSDQAATWDTTVDVSWIVDAILEPRAFTNLQFYPIDAHKYAIDKVRKWISEMDYRLYSKTVCLHFSAKGCFAERTIAAGRNVNIQEY
jgi:hypothetical protein